MPRRPNTTARFELQTMQTQAGDAAQRKPGPAGAMTETLHGVFFSSTPHNTQGGAA